MEVLAKIFQLWESIWRHFLWIQVLQVSHWIAGWRDLHGREQIPQGNFVVGPGLDSISPEIIRRERIQAGWEADRFRFRAELLLILWVEEWGRTRDRVMARLTLERE